MGNKQYSFFSDLLKRRDERGLLSFEATTLVYMALTTIVIGAEWGNLNSPLRMLAARGLMLLVMAVMWLVHRRYPCKATVLLRISPIFLSLIYWYPETYEFCQLFDYKDHIFASIDYSVFGFQPSLKFGEWLSSTFWYELFNMGYYSYYYLMIAMVLFYFLARYADFQRATFVFLGSFFLFYLVFDFLPVAGPQYYYAANGVAMGESPVFPEMHDYFRTNTEILPLEVRGLFSRLVLQAQEAGEHPTAAFPSSHVGMAVVTMLLAWRTGSRKFFWILFPFALILFFATVYLKAHYAVDSVAGLFAGAFFFWLTNRSFPWFSRKLKLKP